MRRREFLELLGAGACVPFAASVEAQVPTSAPKADVTLHISPVEVEIAPGKKIKTTGYNGSAPGPFLRFREGRRVIVDVFNDTKEPELVHWHGFFLPPDIDGAMEEGTPFVEPGSSQRYSFVPRPSGTRWYHSHVYAGRNLKRSTYTGQFGMVYIEPRDDPGAYDAEHLLCLHGWDPYLSSMGGDGSLEAVYNSFSVNDRAFGHGEPIRVREGQRVLFRILNASATQLHRIALAGHKLKVISLDGNPVPAPHEVESLTLGAAERADVIATMNNPGVWVFGEVDDQIRAKGLGILVEYENQSGEPQWVAPGSATWDYTLFGTSAIAPQPDETVPMVFRRKFAGNNWVDHWTINGKEFPKADPILLRANRKYRLQFDNQSDDDHPVHLHRHSFELTRYAGKSTAGVVKDVVMIPKRSQVEVDFVANDPGLTLFHCHNQLHMDFGFMTLFRYADS
ncbi:MAG TPA: multicopper oxidase domain-containing protein [Candidatus Baltobacteraceae bacterium]|jgi:FtsP/CotA-like multicopper oxidase with cupredoxin domain|nr:multicopper oxidase domain-containing protein [Candidatus Baltobacteraceae bacterium]